MGISGQEKWGNTSLPSVQSRPSPSRLLCVHEAQAQPERTVAMVQAAATHALQVISGQDFLHGYEQW